MCFLSKDLWSWNQVVVSLTVMKASSFDHAASLQFISWDRGAPLPASPESRDPPMSGSNAWWSELELCNNRSKVHNKCNALESSWNPPLPCFCGTVYLPWNWSLVPKWLGNFWLRVKLLSYCLHLIWVAKWLTLQQPLFSWVYILNFFYFHREVH